MDQENTPLQTTPISTEISNGKSRISGTEIWRAICWPLFFLIVLWIIELAFEFMDFRSPDLGIHPRDGLGLTGILTAPLIHANLDHLVSNSIPLLVVGSGIAHFYQELKWKVIGMIWLLTGFWVWLIGRPEYHIGASGLIYGGVVFLFFSGVFRKDVRLMAVSMLVVFLYGSLAWGILPVDPTQSWESHLSGSIAGLVVAVYYRKEKPYRHKYQWEIDEELELNQPELTADEQSNSPIHVTYHFVPDEQLPQTTEDEGKKSRE